MKKFFVLGLCLFALSSVSTNLFAFSSFSFSIDDPGINKKFIEDLGTFTVPGYGLILLQEASVEISNDQTGQSFVVECKFKHKGKTYNKCVSLNLKCPNSEAAAKAHYKAYINTLESIVDVTKGKVSREFKNLHSVSQKMSMKTVTFH